jgi:hypothetical protein
MHRAAAISLAILLASTALTAQTTPRTGFGVASMEGIGPAQAQATVVQAPPPSCPVNLTARQSPGANRMEVNGVQAKGIVQNLHLTVTGPNSKRVVAAKVTVYGFAGKVRAVETSSAPSEIATDLAVPGFSGVRVIDLNAVTYADGSTWKLAAGSTCSSRIDPIMQVSGR